MSWAFAIYVCVYKVITTFFYKVGRADTQSNVFTSMNSWVDVRNQMSRVNYEWKNALAIPMTCENDDKPCEQEEDDVLSAKKMQLRSSLQKAKHIPYHHE